MQVILVRHAQPVIEVNDDRIADPGLSELGRWQADRLCDWLDHEPIDAVVTSPKTRAIETVRPLIERRSVPHQVMVDLDEIDRGAFVYMPTELLPTEGGAYWEAVMEQRWDDIGWDSPEAFADRVAAAWDALVADPPGERVLVGCHGGTIRFVLGHVLGLAGSFHLVADYAGITRLLVDTGSGHTSVHSVNESGHFDAERQQHNGAMRDGQP